MEDCISKIGISSRFLLSLINDILDMSRIESGKMLLKNEKIPTEEFLVGINSICYGQAEPRAWSMNVSWIRCWTIIISATQ